jgi:Bacterial Ig domain
MVRRVASTVAAVAVAAAALAGAATPASGVAIVITPTPDAYSVLHDHKLVVPDPGVLGNDIGLAGSDAVLDTGPSHGSLNLGNGGGFTYMPDAGYVGTDGFTYHPSGTLVLGTTVTITVADVAPVAVADTYATAAGTELRVDPPGVLANDKDADGDDLTAALLSDVSHGSLELRTTGEVRYTPAAGFSGLDGFTYRAWDGAAWSLPAAVTITVVAPTPRPTTRPSATPKPAPTPTPIALPSPTVEPSPSGSAVPSPTPAPTARPSAGAGGGSGGSGDGGSGTTSPSTPAPVAIAGTTGSDGTGGGGAGDGGDGPYALGPPAVDPIDVATVGSSGLGAYDWAVPAAVLSVPGFLLILFVLVQAAAGLLWVPLARRRLRGLGTGSDPPAR